MSKVVYGGRVGVPRDGERVCPSCNGTGHDPVVGYQLIGGCDRCDGTGVVHDLRVGDKEPIPKPKLNIRPNAPIDNRPSFQPSRGPKK